MQQLTRREAWWNPFREIDDLNARMNRLFGTMRWDGELSDWLPPCDVSETEKEYRIRIELPNIKKEDVHVKMENGILTVKGERKEEKEEKDVTFHRREMSYGKFVRRFTMPEEVDEAKIQANFRDGILDLVMAKTTVAPVKTREIPIH